MISFLLLLVIAAARNWSDLRVWRFSSDGEDFSGFDWEFV